MRSLTRSWGFTAAAGTLLALTIGANIAIFSVVNTVLLQPLAYPDAERLVSVETLWTNTGRASQDVSGPDFLDWQAENDVFEQLAAYFGGNENPVIVGDRAVFANSRVRFGRVLRCVRPERVRGTPADTARCPGGTGSGHGRRGGVSLGRDSLRQCSGRDRKDDHGLRRHGGDRRRDDAGIPVSRFHGYLVAHAPDQPRSNRSDHPYQSVGKLKREADLTRAQAQMRPLATRSQGNIRSRFKTATVIPLQQRLTGSLEATLWVLMSAVGVVWLIGCANIANLLLARAAGRTREIALRAALGAGRVRVMRQLLTESCVLAGGAGLAGLLLASLLVQGVVALSPANVPASTTRGSTRPSSCSRSGSRWCRQRSGLVPALHASRLDLSNALKQGGSKATASRAGARLRSVLVVAEVALSVILLATAGLLVRSFLALQQVDLGFTTDRVLVAYTNMRSGTTSPRTSGLEAGSMQMCSIVCVHVPGVSAASGVAYLGMGREPRSPRDVYIQGRPEGRPGERPQARCAITADYFKTLEIPLRAGRDFDRTDTPERPRVAIVNETLARTAFPGESPIGQRIQTGQIVRRP